MIVLNQRHAQRLLGEFRDWYNQDRVNLALGKDAPDHRAIEPPKLGKVVVLPRLGGLIIAIPVAQPEGPFLGSRDSDSWRPSK